MVIVAVAKKTNRFIKLKTIIQMQNNNKIQDQSGNSYNHLLGDVIC